MLLSSAHYYVVAAFPQLENVIVNKNRYLLQDAVWRLFFAKKQKMSYPTKNSTIAANFPYCCILRKPANKKSSVF